MTRRLGALLSTLANGDPVDWRLVESASWEGTSVSRRGTERLGVAADRLARAGWAGVLSLALAQCVVMFALVPDVLATSGRSSPGWLPVVNVTLFGASGLLLVIAGRRDLRASALGGLFLLIAAAFAQLGLARATGATPGPAVGLLRTLFTDAFLAAALWKFAWEFPRAPRDGRLSRLGTIMLAASTVLGLVLFLLNAVDGLNAGVGSLVPAVVFRALDREVSGSAYWLLLFGAALPALLFLPWKVRVESADQRRRVRFFLTAIVVGLSPIVVAVIGAVFVPWIGGTPWRQLIGVVVYAALASTVPAAAYSVLVDRVLDLRLSMARSTRWMAARYGVWLAGLGPLSYFGVDLYIHRDQTLTAHLAGSGSLGLYLLLIVGFTSLTFRYQLLRGVDRWFERDRADYAESAVRLERQLRVSRTVQEIVRALSDELERAVRPETVSVLLLDAAATSHVPVAGPAPPLAAESMLLQLVRGAPDGHVVLTSDSPITPLLPPLDQAWLLEAQVPLVSALQGSLDRILGVVALGRMRNGLEYSQGELAFIRSMCSRAALQLENLRLSDREEAQRRELEPGQATAIDWQKEPAGLCPRCSLVWPREHERCSCGQRLTVASLPLLVHGKFRLERLLGAGGMGVVYLATDMTLGRKLALKTLPAATEALAARLQHEARTMAHVRHPHLASIYGAEQWRGAPVLLVEFLEGGTLLDWLRRGPFTVDEALSLGIVLADALDSLHRAGILHRDVKPSNIGYTLTGEAKLLDLGLAATIQGHEDRLDAPASDDLPGSGDPGHQTPGGRGHSQSGPLLGTLRYMAPEALEGNPPGPSLDLWSLAFVLYEAIAGRHPLAELGAEDLVGRVRQGLVPDLRDFSPDCPASVAAFFRDALSPVLERRPQSAAAFRAALQHLRAELLAA